MSIGCLIRIRKTRLLLSVERLILLEFLFADLQHSRSSTYKRMKYQGQTGEYFEIQHIDSSNCAPLKEQLKDTLRLLWFVSDNNNVRIDGEPYTFNTNDIVCLTQFHTLDYEMVHKVNLLRFNQPFYCILDHDSEVGCKGILYYGASAIPIFRPDQLEIEVLDTAWKMAGLEFEMHDSMQLEMMQMMLKRILILCTRMYKRQTDLNSLDVPQNDLVRQFNYLVETHFREKHTVAEYAELLFKAPKTISNTFKKMGEKAPLQFIQDRLMLEARRKLWYTDEDVSEISHEMGFNDVQTFSRFFKNQQDMSPSHYRNMHQGKD
ncbi:MAG: AraC family transcriptional activator of pobA [Flavobacteriales bacterium]